MTDPPRVKPAPSSPYSPSRRNPYSPSRRKAGPR